MDNDLLPRRRWAKILVCAGYAAAALLAARLSARVIPAALPFGCAFACALILRRPAGFIARRTRVPYRAAAAALTAVFLAAALAFAVFAASRIVAAAPAAVDMISDAARGIVRAVSSAEEKLRTAFPSLAGGSDALGVAVDSVVGELAGRLGSAVTSVAASVASAAPSAVLAAAVFVASAFYFTCGMPRVIGALRPFFKPGALRAVRRVRSAFIAYLKSAVIGAAASFAILSFGFVCMRVGAPFTRAALCALLDFLPVFGVGTALLPWAAVCAFTGRAGYAASLAALYAVCTLTRQFIEPRVLAGAAGVPPIVTLAATYAGYRVGGIAGMIFLPVAVAVAFGALSRPRDGEEI